MINGLIVSTCISSFMYLFSSSIKLLLEPGAVYHGPYSHGTFGLAAVNYPFSLLKNIDIVGVFFCFVVVLFFLVMGVDNQGYNKEHCPFPSEFGAN